MLGSEAIIECLKREGVDLIFGYPGGAVLTLYDAIHKLQLPHILTRHEQGAVHAADGYARATGKTGVCFATSGPGGTNLVTGIANAYMDSVPIVAITGQVSVDLIGKDSFQEADICGITTPITKHNYLVKKPEELTRVLKEAFYIASTGRPGPVVVDVSKDVFNAVIDFEYPEEISLRGYSPVFAGEEESIDQLVEVMKKAKKPLIFVGGGVVLSDTSNELRKLTELTGFPVTTSIMGLGTIPSDDPNCLGMLGMHGTYVANMGAVDCDFLLGIGVRFDDRVTGLVKKFASNAYIAHMDIDKAEVNKNVLVDLKVVGDLKWSLPLLLDKIEKSNPEKYRENVKEWMTQIKEWQQEVPLPQTYPTTDEGILPEKIITEVSNITGGDATLVTDVGQHQMWAAQYSKFIKPRSFFTSGGLGAMGYGLPAAMGAKFGIPQEQVILFTGDGSIMMNCQELSTIADNDLPLKIIVLNNEVLGMVHQWQRMFYGGRYIHSTTKGKTDLVKLAEAMGVTAFRIEKEEELVAGLRKALIEIKGPVLVDIVIPQTANVLPMVPPGSRLDQMILGGKD